MFLSVFQAVRIYNKRSAMINRTTSGHAEQPLYARRQILDYRKTCGTKKIFKNAVLTARDFVMFDLGDVRTLIDRCYFI